MIGMKKILFLTPLILFVVSSGCWKKDEPKPISVSLSAGITVNLPAGWTSQGTKKEENMEITVITRDTDREIRAVILPAREIPFEHQIQQDRNNLNLEKGYRILLEKNMEVQGNPGYVFIVTLVEEGKRLKSKIILFQKEKKIIYLTLKTGIHSFQETVADFNAMIDSL
jgi:hypothetical protein